MKVLVFSVLVSLSAFYSFESLGSAYPPDYCHQSVRVNHEGPMLIASVGSGCFGAVVFGYKSSGPLAQSNPEHIDMIVIGKCSPRQGVLNQKQTHVRLGREWHGNGYLSSEHSPYSFLPEYCYGGSGNISYEFAFSDGRGNWDSKNGANYRLQSFVNPSHQSFRTNEAGHRVNLKAWEIIVDQMKR